jgi:hypothetical protein
MNSSISRAWNLQWSLQSNTNNIIISVSSTDPSTVESRSQRETTYLQSPEQRTPVSVKVTDTPSSSQPSSIMIRAGNNVISDSQIDYIWKINSPYHHHFDLHLYIDGTFKIDAYTGSLNHTTPTYINHIQSWKLFPSVTYRNIIQTSPKSLEELGLKDGTFHFVCSKPTENDMDVDGFTFNPSTNCFDTTIIAPCLPVLDTNRPNTCDTQSISIPLPPNYPPNTCSSYTPSYSTNTNAMPPPLPPPPPPHLNSSQRKNRNKRIKRKKEKEARRLASARASELSNASELPPSLPPLNVLPPVIPIAVDPLTLLRERRTRLEEEEETLRIKNVEERIKELTAAETIPTGRKKRKANELEDRRRMQHGFQQNRLIRKKFKQERNYRKSASKQGGAKNTDIRKRKQKSNFRNPNQIKLSKKQRGKTKSNNRRLKRKSASAKRRQQDHNNTNSYSKNQRRSR